MHATNDPSPHYTLTEPVPARLGVPESPPTGVPAASDARVYMQLIRENAARLAVTALIAMALTGLWLLSVDRIYETSALLRIDDDKGFMDKLLEKESNPFSTAPLAKEEARVLRSRTVLGSAVDAVGLTIEVEPVFLPVLGKVMSHYPSVVERLRAWFPPGYAWGGERAEVGFLELPQALYGKPLTLVASGGGRFSLEYEGKILVADGEVGKFAPLRAPVESGDEKGFSILINQLRADPGTRFRVVRHSRASRIDALRQALTINARETGTRVLELVLSGKNPETVARTLDEIVEAYLQLRLSWSSSETRQELAFLEARMPEAREKLKQAEDALALFREQNRSLDLDAESRQAIGRVAELEAELRSLKQQRELLSQQYTALYPEVEKLDAEIGTTAALLAAARSKIRKMPEVGRDLQRLEREVALHSKLYASLEQRYEKLRVAEASALGSVRIIDRPIVPDKPVWPRASVMVPLAVLGAVFVHLVWLLVRAAFSNRVQDARTVETVSGAPVFVDIPFSEKQRRSFLPKSHLLPGAKRDSGVLAIEHPDDFTVETLRGLRAMLGRLLAENGMLMVCGPLPKMGKSFVSINLAVLLAETGKKVLLVDADFLRGRLHKDFDIDNETGLTLVAEGDAGLEQAIRRTSVAGLDLMPRGPGEPPNDERLEMAMRRLAELVGPVYDHVIIDAPPILSLSTSAIVGRVAGACLMVVRRDEVTVEEMQAAVKRLRLADVEIDGCLLNSMNADKQRQAYRYGYSA